MRMTTKVLSISCTALAALSIAATTYAGAITPGNLVVTREGDGSAALTGAATAVFLDEYTTVASTPKVQTINMPTSASGAQLALTNMGTSTSEGFLTLSSNGQYLTLGGYNNAPGTATPTSSANNRVVGRVDLAGNVDTSTLLSDASNGNIRSVVSDNGTNLWAATSAGGVRYTTFNSTAASTQLNAASTNDRVVNIASGQLYSTVQLNPNTVGSGLPTTSGQTLTVLPGFPTTGTHSNYDYWFKDANTLYVADDGSAAGGGGIQKWTLSAGTWSLAYTLLNNGTTTTALRGLAGTTDGSGNAVLFGVGGPSLVTVTDTGAGSVGTVLQTAPTNTAFRGVEFIPVPEPATFVLAGIGIVGLVGFARARCKPV